MKCFLALLFTYITTIGVAQKAVYFDFDKYNLSTESKATLDAISKLGNIERISIVGYTDSVGSITYNTILSKNRMLAVKNYLTNKKINVKLEVDYKGELMKEPTDALNRKVELVITYNEENIAKIDSIPIKKTPIASKDVVKVKKRLNFTKIYFVPSTPTFKQAAYKELDSLYREMLKLTNEKIEIRGHINWPPQFGPFTQQSQYANLSLNRAKAVYQYLQQKGIDMTNITVRGMDNTEMVYQYATTQYEMEQNMRVEIAVLE